VVKLEYFTDDQIRELRDNAEEMFREVYLSVADLPKSDWPAIRIKHLKDLQTSIATYEAEIVRRETGRQAAAPSIAPRAARAFISYAHLDEAYKSTLERHLALLHHLGLIETWTDRQLLPGQEWDAEIQKRLTEADLILLLVSANFFASTYSYQREMQVALDRRQKDGVVVIPIILSAVDWERAPLARFQALPKNALPIASWPNQDEAWADVAKGIRRVVEQQGYGI
jgi:hypothetical protein